MKEYNTSLRVAAPVLWLCLPAFACGPPSSGHSRLRDYRSVQKASRSSDSTTRPRHPSPQIPFPDVASAASNLACKSLVLASSSEILNESEFLGFGLPLRQGLYVEIQVIRAEFTKTRLEKMNIA